MIKVVDMIMGGYKTTAAITYMNEHPDRRFLYVTPFLPEVRRIVDSCRGADFVQPDNTLKVYGNKKMNHFRSLVNQGRNIAMTHALFSKIDDVTATIITDRQYVIIIDEVMDVFEPLSFTRGDIKMAVNAGFLIQSDDDGEYRYFETGDEAEDYTGEFRKLFERAKLDQVVRTRGWDDPDRTKLGFWMLNRRLFRMAEEMFVLTYLFDGAPLKGYFDVNKIPYEYIGVRLCEDGLHRFSKYPETPAYVANLRGHVHLCDKPSINNIGAAKFALSKSWYERAVHNGDISKIRGHIDSFFRRHVPAGIDADQRMYAVWKDFEKSVRAKGFTNSHLVFNSKATNEYKEKAALAYCVNIFPQPDLESYLKHNDANIDWDQYAVSNMVQWIWRSRIREGRDIWLYIPSRRMRELFISWMKRAEAAYAKEVMERNARTEDPGIID